jgi:PAS domain S-box-containing protein
VDGYLNPERRGNKDGICGQSPVTEWQQPKLNVDDQQRHRLAEQSPLLVAAGTQEAVAEKEKMLQAIFHTVADPMFLLDRERRIVTCNEAAAKQVGRPVQELIGLAMFDCLAAIAPDRMREQYVTRIDEAFRSAAPVCFTDERDGLVFDNTIHPVLGGDGQATGVVVFVRDVTEYRRAQRELRECHESMRHAERLTSLGVIIATLTHELAQPLSVVRLMIQSVSAELAKLDCPDTVRQDLQAGLAACANIDGLVSRLRDLARQPGKPKEVEVSIQHVAERTFRLLEQSAKQAKVKFWTENLEALPAVRMRENELDQVFFALAQNAVQAADGMKDCHLLITGTLHEDMIILQFRDNCGGIDPVHLPRIFEPFFTTKPSGKGTGLGLCIARRIACQKGGQISVENQHGEGTTFTVTLPRVSSPGMGGRYVR